LKQHIAMNARGFAPVATVTAVKVKSPMENHEAMNEPVLTRAPLTCREDRLRGECIAKQSRGAPSRQQEPEAVSFFFVEAKFVRRDAARWARRCILAAPAQGNAR